MKKIAVVAFCLMGYVGCADANELGLPESIVSALNTNKTTCAKIVQTGERVSYVSVDGYHAAKVGSKMIRFFTASSAMPFKGNAIVVDKGIVTKQVVDVETCQQAPVVAQEVKMPAAASMQKLEMQPQPVVAKVEQKRVVDPVQTVATERQVSMVTERPAATKPMIPIAVASSEKGNRKIVKGDAADGDEGSVFDNLDAKVTLSHMESMGNSDRKRSGNSVTVEGTYYQPAWDGKGRVGVHATYTKGNSDSVNPTNNRETKTDYWKVGGGVVSEYEFARNTDFIVEADLLYQDTKGFTPAKNIRSHQTEWQVDLDLSVASDDNRKNGILWIPYWEVGARAVKSFGVDYSDSKGTNDWYDNSRYSVYADADIYDFYGGNWRFTPNVGLEAGYMVGKSAAFIEPGISTKIAYAGKEIFETGFDWRFMTGDNRWYWFGTIRPVAIGRILWAQKTTDYTSSRD